MRRISREAIIADMIKQNDQAKGSGSWLNNGLHFNHSLKLNKNIKENLENIFGSCGIPKRKENYLNLEILIANLLIKRDIRPVITSLNTTDWKITKYTKAGEGTIKLIYKLKECGYIELKKGYRTNKESRKSRIWPTNKLLDYFPRHPNNVIYEQVEIVQLRDDERHLIDYKDTVKTRKIRATLTQVNNVNNWANIKYKIYTLHPLLIAVFRRKFTLNGRLYTTGIRHYQGFSSDERKKITINNDSIVELDYSGLHPHLLYAKEGIQFNEDPYSIVDKRPEARDFLKIILLSMVNSKDEKTAEKAANYWLYKNHYEREELKKIGITRAKPVMDEFRKAHKDIKKYFCNGNQTGLRLMNLDSSIALEVVGHFAKKNIPILCIHDSFIVQEKYQIELQQIMNETYEKHTKGFKCKIK